QIQTVILNPIFGDPFAGGFSTSTPLTSTTRTRSADFVAPYNVRGQFGLDQKVNNQMGFNVSYDYSRGDHLLRTRNVNAPLPACVSALSINPTTQQVAACRPDATLGNIYQYES